MLVHHNINQLPPFKHAVLTVGSFDGVHVGHLAILAALIQTAERLTGESVVITFDPHPRKYLSSDKIGLLHSLAEKIASLEKIGIDHLVVVPFNDAFAKQSPEVYLSKFLREKFKPKAIVLGYDHRFGSGGKGNINLLRQVLTEVELIEISANTINDIKISSTKIRKALGDGNIKLANNYLLDQYSLKGTVVHGDKVGQLLGFPTANIQIADDEKIIPADGVYAVTITLAEQAYQGMLHLGNRPTIDGKEQRLEVHIFNFNLDIYDKEITIQFIDFIRQNHKFENKTALVNQLKTDKEKCLQLFKNQLIKKQSTAVVILNYNGTKHLKTYLPSVFAHTPDNINIYVADNGSTDDSIAFLRSFQKEENSLKIIALPKNFGFAGGYNEALKQVDADIYILLNSDVRVTKNWTAALTDAMLDPTLSACQPKILSDLTPHKFEYAGASGGFIDFLGYPFCRGRIFGVTEEDKGQYNDEKEIFWATGAAMVIRSKLFWDFKGFDATFFAHNEEIDLCWQIKRAGFKIKVIPSSKVYHLGGGTLSYNTPNKVYLNFRNNLKMLFKNDKALHLLWKIPARLLLDGLAGVLFLFQGQYTLIWSIIRAHFAFYKSIPQLILKRNEIKQILISLPNKPIKKPTGIYKSSVVWRFYALGKQTYSDLLKK